MGGIIYASISRGSIVLVEHAATTGNFASISTVILEKVPPGDSQVSYSYDQYFFHILKHRDIVYLCLADSDFPRRQAFLLLQNVQESFVREIGDRSRTASAYGLTEFGNNLAHFMHSHSSPDKLTSVKQEVDQVRDIMQQNIERVLERGERFENIASRTESLAQQSQAFRKRATTLRREMWWKNQKLIILSATSGIIVLYFLVGFGCGFPGFSQCIG
ncbi:Vesicle-associated membrane protein [Boothiomyces sp. JEL0866]|nr:Vesicle-associated membrane protein [Boothiomyces sp. JEL0866]